MGMDLNGQKSDLSLNFSSWRSVYDLAIENGWKPEGTKTPGEIQIISPDDDGGPFPEKDPDLEGGYFSNSYQLVTDEDANNMADAVERSFGSQPGEFDEYLRKFIVFAREGYFLIG
jgi:hypothetical protein